MCIYGIEVNSDEGPTLLFLVINISKYIWVKEVFFLLFSLFKFFVNIFCHFKSVFLKIYLYFLLLFLLLVLPSLVKQYN